MDILHEPYWTIEEIAVWARCRDPDVVNLLRTPALDGRHINLVWCMDQAAMAARARGRNIERELFEAWGRPTPLTGLIEPWFVVGRIINDFAPEWLELEEAYGKASLSDQRRVADAFDLAAVGQNEFALTAQLPAPFDVLVGNVLARRRSDARSFGYLPVFSLEDYLLELLRAGQFNAVGNLPNETLARELALSDWRGLTIAPASDTQRLCVWRLGNNQRVGRGDIENVRVVKEAVLKAFPGDALQRPPIQATDEDARRVIREKMASRGGFVSQKNGARIVRAAFPGFNAVRAMQLTKELTGNTKPGPRGPRGKSSQ
jgi:hypothetical protein